MKHVEQALGGGRQANDLAEIERLIGIYRSLAELLRKTDRPALERLAASWDSTLPQLRQRLESASSREDWRLAKKGLLQGLKELPKLLAAIEGLDRVQLMSSIESELNFKLSDV